MSDKNFPPPDVVAENLDEEIRKKASQVQQLLHEIELLLSDYSAKAENDAEKTGFALTLVDELFNPVDGTAQIEPWFERMVELVNFLLKSFHQSMPTDEQLEKLLSSLGYDKNLIAVVIGVLGTDLSRLLDADDEELTAVFESVTTD